MSYRRHLLPAASLLLCLTTCAVAVRSYLALDFFHLNAGSLELYLDIRRGSALLQLATHVPPALRGHQPFHTTPTASPLAVLLNSKPSLTFHGFLGEYFARVTTPPTIVGYVYFVPLWHLIALTAILPLFHAYRLWRAHRPRPPQSCPTCGYDCRATPNRCPECGTALPDTTSPAIPPTPPL